MHSCKRKKRINRTHIHDLSPTFFPDRVSSAPLQSTADAAGVTPQPAGLRRPPAMPLRYRRTLLSGQPYGDCNDWNWDGCPSPPSPAHHTFLPPAPSPSPSLSPSPPITWPPCLSWIVPCPTLPGDLAPAPSPFYDPNNGRRNQGGTGSYAPPAPGAGSDDHRRRLMNFALIGAAAIVLISVILLGVTVAIRRRQVRRRRQALLAPAPAAVTNGGAGGNDDPEGGGGGVVHHIWYIRTVGLDEAAIDSLGATRYRAGAGLLGAADCSVCLAEFQDGEHVRLLPKCAHAFHVPCIDTWLRAHVNCPVCRSDVLGPAVTAAAGDPSSSNPQADPDANVNAAAEQAAAASDSASTEHEEEENDQEAPPRHVEEERDEQVSSPEPLPQLPCRQPRNVRRAASMDAVIVSAAVAVAELERLPETAPEREQSGRRKHRAGAKGSGSGHLGIDRPGGAPRSFFARHGRARSSVLPL